MMQQRLAVSVITNSTSSPLALIYTLMVVSCQKSLLPKTLASPLTVICLSLHILALLRVPSISVLICYFVLFLLVNDLCWSKLMLLMSGLFWNIIQ